MMMMKDLIGKAVKLQIDDIGHDPYVVVADYNDHGIFVVTTNQTHPVSFLPYASLGRLNIQLLDVPVEEQTRYSNYFESLNDDPPELSE